MSRHGNQWRGVLCDVSIDLPFKHMVKNRLLRRSLRTPYLSILFHRFKWQIIRYIAKHATALNHSWQEQGRQIPCHFLLFGLIIGWILIFRSFFIAEEIDGTSVTTVPIFHLLYFVYLNFLRFDTIHCRNCMHHYFYPQHFTSNYMETKNITCV